MYENYPTTGKGQEEIDWNPSFIETLCDEHSYNDKQEPAVCKCSKFV